MSIHILLATSFCLISTTLIGSEGPQPTKIEARYTGEKIDFNHQEHQLCYIGKLGMRFLTPGALVTMVMPSDGTQPPQIKEEVCSPQEFFKSWKCAEELEKALPGLRKKFPSLLSDRAEGACYDTTEDTLFVAEAQPAQMPALLMYKNASRWLSSEQKQP